MIRSHRDLRPVPGPQAYYYTRGAIVCDVRLWWQGSMYMDEVRFFSKMSLFWAILTIICFQIAFEDYLLTRRNVLVYTGQLRLYERNGGE